MTRLASRFASRPLTRATAFFVCLMGLSPTVQAQAHDNFSQHLILSDRQIPISGLPGSTYAYNPSIVSFGTGSLLVFRVDHTDGYGSTRIGAVELNANFDQVGAPSLLDLRPEGMHRHTAEDPRLLWCESEICLVYNLTSHDYPGAARTLNIAKLEVTTDPQGGVVVTAPVQVGVRVPLGEPQRIIEKNWTPFMHDHAVHFIYTTNPPHILRLPDKALAGGAPVVSLEKAAHEAPFAAWPHGEMRGGSPAVWDPNLRAYGSFFHGKTVEQVGWMQKHNLTIGYYTFFGESPFAIESIIAQPIVPPDFHASDTPTLSCAYPGGFFHRGASTLVVYGYQDMSIHLMELDTQKLYGALMAAPAP